MRYKDAAALLKQKLQLIYDPREASNITNLVMHKLTGFTRSGLLTQSEVELSRGNSEQLKKYIGQLIEYRPVQYVLEEAWFANLPFFVDERVLIPRPETEELTEWAATELKKKSTVTDIRILDIGTGSGCIAITLKKIFPGAEVWAIDASAAALEVARLNSVKHNVDLQFRQVDILEPSACDDLPVFDLVISNPPYIPPSDRKEMHPHVLRYEPHGALFVTNEDPLQFYRAIAGFFLQHHAQQSLLFFETHELHGGSVGSLLRSMGLGDVEIRQDLQGKDRLVMCTS